LAVRIGWCSYLFIGAYVLQFLAAVFFGYQAGKLSAARKFESMGGA